MHSVIRYSVLLGLLACAWSSPATADPDALWHIVHDHCVPHQERFQAPFPCLETDERDGVALLKDLVGQTQTLLIPTARVTGAEGPAVLDPAAPNYFQLAWRRIGMTRALADVALPRNAISLALNSKYGRTQNQLHIHIDCLLPRFEPVWPNTPARSRKTGRRFRCPSLDTPISPAGSGRSIGRVQIRFSSSPMMFPAPVTTWRR